MTSNKTTGHRARLRTRFLNNDKTALTDEALLELLLTYAIPRKDVQPIARQLLSKFGDLRSALHAKIENLCKINGIGEQAAILIKLAAHLTERISKDEDLVPKPSQITSQLSLPFPPTFESKPKEPLKGQKKPPKISEFEQISATPLFANAVLKEAIQLLPKLPVDTKMPAEARQFFREHLHYSADSTRRRNSSYIVRRMFFNGALDPALISFAKSFAKSRDLREVCFYRFIKAEPLSVQIINNLLIPNIGQGKLMRAEIKNYLQSVFPGSKSIGDCVKAFSSAIDAAGIGRPNPKEIHFNYRDIPINAFAFVLHSEYDKPGMYDLEEVERNPIFKTMLWKSDQILPALYTLRNSGIISKISDIDQIRQITTRFNLEQCVQKLKQIKFENEPD